MTYLLQLANLIRSWLLIWLLLCIQCRMDQIIGWRIIIEQGVIAVIMAQLSNFITNFCFQDYPLIHSWDYNDKPKNASGAPISQFTSQLTAHQAGEASHAFPNYQANGLQLQNHIGPEDLLALWTSGPIKHEAAIKGCLGCQAQLQPWVCSVRIVSVTLTDVIMSALQALLSNNNNEWLSARHLKGNCNWLPQIVKTCLMACMKSAIIATDYQLTPDAKALSWPL